MDLFDFITNLGRIVRAIATDQIAWLMPALYVRLTGQTGRGEEVGVGLTADYFHGCFQDYFQELGIAADAIPAYLYDMQVVEYGPGDMPAVALLMVAYGARCVVCVDRFPLLRLSPQNIEVLKQLVTNLPAAQRARAEQCFVTPGQPDGGFNPACIEYRVTPNGLSGLADWADLIVSRAVLEHVNDLNATFADMYAALRPGATAIHLVDLRSHGLHRHTPLDFLCWPTLLWNWMYGHKGVPNRWRVDRYRAVLQVSGLETLALHPVAVLEQGLIDVVRPKLARPFRHLNDQDLSWLNFWLVCRKPVANP
ncbi:MAG: methyltransferase domain-containing protein [Pseudomonadota bacterium]